MNVTPGGEAKNLKGRQGQRKFQGICLSFLRKTERSLRSPCSSRRGSGSQDDNDDKGKGREN